jgi:ligand-binding sensor domain-containing protein
MKKYKFQRLLPLLLFSLLLLTSCKGQETPAARQMPEKAPAPPDYTGQISEYVVEVMEDSKGNLWFGTMSDGAARFNGKTLTYFSTKDGLCDNTVVSIAEDRAGNIWFGTHNGVSKFNGKTFVNFGQTEGIHGMGCVLLVDSRGNIWAGTNHGAFRFNGFSFSPFPIPTPTVADSSRKWEAGKVWGLMEDKKGNIWFARDAYGACKFDGSTFTHFTKKEGLCSNNVCGIVEDKQGNIWFGCLSTDLPKEVREGGVCRFDGKTMARFPEQEGMHQNDIYSIYADKKGNVWMGATGLGVYRYDGQAFQLFKGTDRMDLTWSVGIQSILEDSKGTLWFGFSGGLFQFDGRGIVNIPKQVLLK